MRPIKSGRVVEVVPYDSRWISMFSEEGHILRRVFGDDLLEAHHIGSTAIPGMCAKPTIDVLIVVRDIDAVDGRNGPMSQIGYVPMGEYGIRGRRFFVKGGDRRTHHVHVFERGSPEIERHLLFRDYLTAHPSEAAEYAEVKRGLASRLGTDIDAYCEGKDAFIKGIDAKAAVWARSGRSQ